MTHYVRWKPGTVGQYEYFEPMKARWVACDKAMWLFWLHTGPIHMNPSGNVLESLRGELEQAQRAA